MRVTHLSCCGMKEIATLGTYDGPTDALRAFCASWRPTQKNHNTSAYSYYPDETFNCAFVVFSEAGSGAKYATKFAAFITKNELGDVAQVPGKINPNSSRTVRPFIWGINTANLKKWAKENCDWLKTTKSGVNADNV